jgi:hypothetical protein
MVCRSGILFLRHHLHSPSLSPQEMRSIQVAAVSGEAVDLQQPAHLDGEFVYLQASRLPRPEGRDSLLLVRLAVVSALPHLPVRAVLVPVQRGSSKLVTASSLSVSLLPVIGGLSSLSRVLLRLQKEPTAFFNDLHCKITKAPNRGFKSLWLLLSFGDLENGCL